MNVYAGLFDYQRTGVDFLASKKLALLADEMGLGKTAQAIRAADKIGARRILVVCRAIARENWKAEFAKFSTLQRHVEVGYKLGAKVPTAEDLVFVCSYEGVPGVLRSLADSGRGFDLVICDEAHALKGTTAARTASVLGVHGLVRKAKRTWLLTGTPCPNNASELWPFLFTAGATRLNQNEFTEKFCETQRTGFGVKIVGSKTDRESLANFHQTIKPVVLRRTVEDSGLNLPLISYETLLVPKGPVDLAEFAEFRKFIQPFNRLDELQEKIAQEYAIVNGILANNKLSEGLMESLKAVAPSVATLRRFLSLQKIEPVHQMVRQELLDKAYSKIVIFALHRAAIEGLTIRLKDFGAQTLYGGTRPSKVMGKIADFMDPRGKCKVLVCNVHAAGTSINLTAAHNVIFIETSWTPADNDQAVRRCLRIGQEKPVHVRLVNLDEPLEKRVNEVLERKMREIARLLDIPKELKDIF